jgi:hypothetical protein
MPYTMVSREGNKKKPVSGIGVCLHCAKRGKMRSFASQRVTAVAENTDTDIMRVPKRSAVAACSWTHWKYWYVSRDIMCRFAHLRFCESSFVLSG